MLVLNKLKKYTFNSIVTTYTSDLYVQCPGIVLYKINNYYEFYQIYKYERGNEINCYKNNNYIGCSSHINNVICFIVVWKNKKEYKIEIKRHYYEINAHIRNKR